MQQQKSIQFIFLLIFIIREAGLSWVHQGKGNANSTMQHQIILKNKKFRKKIHTKLCFKAPTIASSLASKDIIGLAKVGSADSIWWEQNRYKIPPQNRASLFFKDHDQVFQHKKNQEKVTNNECCWCIWLCYSNDWFPTTLRTWMQPFA